MSIECEVDGNCELEHFDHFVCKSLATYADETVLNEKGRIDYHTWLEASLHSQTGAVRVPDL